MLCCNCNSNDWENVDFARIKPSGMSMCKKCGFISYPDKYKTPEEIKAHYRSSYRNPPTTFNVYAGERKNHFHATFLDDLFTEWKENKKESPVVCEVGAAFGMTLNWVRNVFPKAELYGTELTTSFRRNAMHEFGIKLDEDFDDTKKYDLIISYKVLEHQLDPHKELERYSKCLKPGGRLYISVPTWFNSLYNFGLSGFDIEYYYDPNHINVWTIPMFESILKRSGFKILKSDQVIYSSTYLCESDISENLPLYKEDIESLKNDLQKIKDAYMCLTKNDYEGALKFWPDLPQAHISRLEFKRKDLATMGWEKFKDTYINTYINSCPNSAEAFIAATDFAMRASKFEEAVKYCEKALLMKPENPVSLLQMANTMREMAIKSESQQERLHYLVQAREVVLHLRRVSSQHFKDATDLLYFFNSRIPFNGEANRPLKKVENNAKPELTL